MAPVAFGGDKGVRTPDLMTASHALSQLSYIPMGRRKRREGNYTNTLWRRKGVIYVVVLECRRKYVYYDILLLG